MTQSVYSPTDGGASWLSRPAALQGTFKVYRILRLVFINLFSVVLLTLNLKSINRSREIKDISKNVFFSGSEKIESKGR